MSAKPSSAPKIVTLRTLVISRRLHWALALVLSALVFLGVFVLANPHLIAQRAQFQAGLLSHQGRFVQAALGWGWDLRHPRDIGIDFHTFVTLPVSLGWPLFAVGALAVLYALVDKNRMVRAFAWMTALFYFVVLGNNTLPFMRYTLPVHPAICIFAGSDAGGHHIVAQLQLKDDPGSSGDPQEGAALDGADPGGRLGT